MPDLSITESGKLSAPDLQTKLHRACKAFEASFTAQLLKPLKDENEDSLFPSDPGTKMFKGMMVDGMAEHTAGSLGVAEILEQAMARRLRDQQVDK